VRERAVHQDNFSVRDLSTASHVKVRQERREYVTRTASGERRRPEPKGVVDSDMKGGKALIKEERVQGR
jgi:hypothetical protein